MKRHLNFRIPSRLCLAAVLLAASGGALSNAQEAKRPDQRSGDQERIAKAESNSQDSNSQDSSSQDSSSRDNSTQDQTRANAAAEQAASQSAGQSTEQSEGRELPDALQGRPEAISDWALSGLIWSDAALAKRLAERLASESDDSKRTKRMRSLAERMERVVSQMETFGWKRVRMMPLREASVARLSRFDTETPVAEDDAGFDDELTDQKVDLDIDQYRVDDVVDETPDEAVNPADTIEDGVEKAIASAAGRRAVSGPGGVNISYRETQTRSATLPYSFDTIYDADDFDPDANYQINDPLGKFFDGPDSESGRAEDDEILSGDSTKVVDGEDEFIAAGKRGGFMGSGELDLTNYGRFTDSQAAQPQVKRDAHWVQFHLDANQLRYDQAKQQGRLRQSLRDAMQRLRLHAQMARSATRNESFAQALQQISAR